MGYVALTEAWNLHPRPATRHERISNDPKIMVGNPWIKGTLITVEHILRSLSDGMSHDEIVVEYPHFTRADSLAAQAFAVDYLAERVRVYD